MKFNKVIIKDVVKKKQIEEGYYVTIKYYYWSSNTYCERTWGPFYKGEEDALLRFVNMLEDTLVAFPNGKGGCDEYVDEVPELKNWLESEDEWWDIKDNNINAPEVRLNFSWEKTPDGFGLDAAIDSYFVKYYDNNVYRKVEFKEED
jgi:hypothetical protein